MYKDKEVKKNVKNSVLSMCDVKVSLTFTWRCFDNCFTCLVQPETLSRNESGRFGALKSDSTHHFFRNVCTKSGSLRFSQFSGC